MVIDRSDKTIGARHRRRDGLAEILRKSRDAAQPRQVIAQKGDAFRCNEIIQNDFLLRVNPRQRKGLFGHKKTCDFDRAKPQVDFLTASFIFSQLLLLLLLPAFQLGLP
jgi:hypothetical protein